MKTPCLMFPSNRAVVLESRGLDVQGPPDTKSPRTQHSRTTGDDQWANAVLKIFMGLQWPVRQQGQKYQPFFFVPYGL